MSTDRSIHDNEIYAYVVACESGRITLHTVFRDSVPTEYTDAVFSGVVAHLFEYTLSNNILFGIEEGDIESLICENRALFESSWRWAWPPLDYGGDLNLLTDRLKSRSVRAFLISSSFGLSGWVLCEDCQLVPREQRASIE